MSKLNIIDLIMDPISFKNEKTPFGCFITLRLFFLVFSFGYKKKPEWIVEFACSIPDDRLFGFGISSEPQLHRLCFYLRYLTRKDAIEKISEKS